MIPTQCSRPLTRCRYPIFCLFFIAGILGVQGFSQAVRFRTLHREVIEARLEEGPTQNGSREETLKRIFLEAGCPSDQLIEQKIDESRLPNLICTLPGTSDSTIIVGGHYDMADIGRGVADNWSGASMLPSLYESLSGEPRRHTFVFIGFSSEEKGLYGSQFYVKRLSKEQIARTRAMVNLDTLGLSSTKVEVDISDKRLLNILAQIASMRGLSVAGVNTSKVGMSDADSFARRKIPVLSIHSITQDTWGILHSVRDNLGSIRLEDYYDTYRLMVALLAGRVVRAVAANYSSTSPTNTVAPPVAKLEMSDIVAFPSGEAREACIRCWSA
jgi:hypothetical protein